MVVVGQGETTGGKPGLLQHTTTQNQIRFYVTFVVG